MSVVMKRSCNSNVTVKDDKIVFNSFVLTIDNLRYEEFKIIADNYQIAPETPDPLGHCTSLGPLRETAPLPTSLLLH